MTDFKHLVSPFTLVPYALGPGKIQLKQMPRPAPPCNCDSDEENDFGMAPECAFVCNAINAFTSSSSSPSPNKGKHKSKKRGIRHANANPRTKRARK
uniref:Uncharacterized protein n=1 Tax=viral metagenome TaxID=1070528 RepID=A0A6C0M233_9ZZZZ